LQFLNRTTLKNFDNRQDKKRGIIRSLFDPQMPLALLLFTNSFDFVQTLELLLIFSSSEFRGKFSLFLIYTKKIANSS